MTPLTISEQVERIARIIDPHPFDAGFAPERGAVQNDIDKAADEAREKARAILALASPPEPTAGGGLGYKEHAVGMQTILKCVVSTGDAEALRACHLVFDAFKAADDERVALRAAEPTAGGGVESLRRLSEKATPGEWHVDPKAPEESYFEDVNIIRPDGLAVAVAVQNADIVPPQPEANASFIVACVNYVRSLLASQDHAPSAGAVQGETDPAMVKAMVKRFLTWRLPDDFRPDCGISFDADAAKKLNPINRRYEPVGTNLFSYTQAEAMVRHMLGGDS